MTLPNGTVQDITSDTLLITSKPKIKDNFDDLLENDSNIDSRVTLTEGGSFSSAPKIKLTAEGGYAIKLTNKTGSNSVKGSVVKLSDSVDNAFILQDDEFDAIGIVYENGIADGSECWIVISGIAEVLLKDSTSSTHGYWVKTADTDGRADASSAEPAGGFLTATVEHFKEIGHCLESKTAGTNVLCKCIVHFN